MDMANGMMDQDPQKEYLNSSSTSPQQQQQSSKLEMSEHPFPTPPSMPPDTFENRSSESRQQDEKDPLAASPDLSHPAAVDAFTSDVRDEPPTPSHQPITTQRPNKVEIPYADTSATFDRPLSEPLTTSMDLDEKTGPVEMVNGHKGSGEYTAEDLFSGPAVESPQPTNEPTPPPTTATTEEATLPVPPSMASNVEQAPDVTQPSSVQPPTTTTNTDSLPQQPFHTPQPQPQTPSLPTPAPAPVPVNNNDVEMTNSLAPVSAPKPVRAPPSTADGPPAKRLKTEPATISDPSKKLPDRQFRFLGAALKQLKKSKDAVPFLEPVDPDKLNIPKYFDIIKNPMDLGTIEKKLNQGIYQTARQLIDDFNLMIDNCVTFNGPDNLVTKMGRNLQAMFDKTLKTLPSAEEPSKPAPPPPQPVIAAAPKPKPPVQRRQSGAVPAIRRDSLTADGRPKREIKPPPERDIPMDKPRSRKKNAAELRFCQSVLKELQKKVHEPYSYPFLVPVDVVALNIPDYYKIIKNPMDLSTVDQKLKEGKYSSADEFHADIKLIFKNCYKYNGPDSPIAGLAKQLEKVFDKKWAEKPEELPEKPTAKRTHSSSPVREEESSSDEDEIGRIQEQMTLMAKRLSEMQNRKKQRHEQKSPTGSKSKGSKKAAKTQRSGSGGPVKPKKPKEVIPEVTFEQKRELSEKINFLSPSKMQGVLELIKDAMPLDAAQEEIELDIDVLPPRTLHALYMYVVKDTKVPKTKNSRRAPVNKNKKKREVLSAEAQNRKIAELEGMLNEIDSKPMESESESEAESDDVSSDSD